MATISALWTENQAITFDDTSPAKGVTAHEEIDIAANGYVGIFVTLSIGFQANIDGNAIIYVRGSADSGMHDDSVETPLFSQEVAYSAGNTRYISFTIMDVPYVTISIKNDTSTEDDINIEGWYAGLQYTSA